MNLKNKFLAGTISVVSLFIYSCGSDNSAEDNLSKNQADTTSQTAEVADTSSNFQLYSLPTPMIMASALKNMNGSYNEKYIEPVLESMKKPKGTEADRALALGVYSVDIGYAALFNHQQVAFNIFSNCSKLARDLNVEGEISKETLERFRKNINNRDSLTFIILFAFNKIHNNLYTSERKPAALHIIAGAYIEGSYLAIKSYNSNKNEEIRQVVAEQKVFLENIAELAEQENKDGKNDDLISKLQGLIKAYEKVNIKIENAKIAKIELTPDEFKGIEKSIEEIRNSIINS